MFDRQSNTQWSIKLFNIIEYINSLKLELVLKDLFWFFVFL